MHEIKKEQERQEKETEERRIQQTEVANFQLNLSRVNHN